MAWWLLVGCGEPAEGSRSLQPEDLLPTDGRVNVYTPADDTAAEPLALRAADRTWTLRLGEDWETAEAVAELDVRVGDDGVRVGDDLLLPATVAVGEAGDGVTVVAMDEYTTYYGTWPLAVTVEVDGGRWAGVQVFAAGMGPIAATLDGVSWDLVYYE